MFIKMCRSLGITLSDTPGHLVPPSTRCTALDLEYNLELINISLPVEKVTAMLDTLHEWMARRYATEKDLCGFGRRLGPAFPQPGLGHQALHHCPGLPYHLGRGLLH